MKKFIWYIVLSCIIVVLVLFVMKTTILMDTNKGYPKQLTSTGPDFGPSWSPDGKKIAFRSARETYNPNAAEILSELWIMDEDGSNQRPLVSQKDREFSDSPFETVWGNLSWFPDSQSLLCNIRKKDTTAVWRIFLDGTKKKLTSSEEYALIPECSPDGTKIAFVVQVPNSTESPTYRLHIADSDGSNKLCLIKGLISGYAWTNDSQGIVYALYNHEEKNYDLWEKAVEGTEIKRISRTSVNEVQPSCSPDGENILYVISNEIYITPKNSFKPKKLMSNANNPRWVLGGRAILFRRIQSKGSGQNMKSWSESWIINLDNNVEQKLAEGDVIPTGFSPDGKRYVYSKRYIWLDSLE